LGRERESERKKNVPIKITPQNFLFLFSDNPPKFSSNNNKNTHYKDFGESSGRTREKAERDGKKQ
jgi:hypothetical protein